MAKTHGWERMVDDWAGTDSAKVAIDREMATRFTSLPMLVNHTRGLLKAFRSDEKARVFPDGKGVPAVAVIMWCMLKARSADADQRARWCMYRTSGKRPFPPNPEAEALQVEVAVPARVDPNYVVIARQKPPPCVLVIVIDGDEEQEAAPEVQVVAWPIVPGHKEAPINAEELADFDLPVKTEEEPREEVHRAKKKKPAKRQGLHRSARLSSTPIPRRSARLN